jgi:hypothetical protein
LISSSTALAVHVEVDAPTQMPNLVKACEVHNNDATCFNHWKGPPEPRECHFETIQTFPTTDFVPGKGVHYPQTPQVDIPQIKIIDLTLNVRCQ